MKLTIAVNGQNHTIETDRNGRAFVMDGAAFEAGIEETAPGTYSVLIDGKSFTVRVGRNPLSSESGGYRAECAGTHYDVAVQDPRRTLRARRSGTAVEGRQEIRALMPGKIVRVMVTDGQTVEAGQGLVVVEAMKMQNEIKCPKAGAVVKVAVREGAAVNAGDLLLVIE